MNRLSGLTATLALTAAVSVTGGLLATTAHAATDPTTVTKVDPRGDFLTGPNGDTRSKFTAAERATTDIRNATVSVDRDAATLKVTYRLQDFRTDAADKQFFSVYVGSPDNDRDFIDLTWYRNAKTVRAVTVNDDGVKFGTCKGATIRANYTTDTMTMTAPLTCVKSKPTAKISVASTVNNNATIDGVDGVDDLTDQVTYGRTWNLTPNA